ncbi:MAG: RdgB/HAM1 family non-canonical purine NTP pyrophosphatase [Flavobacteriales bacterium]|nr:RdgB/HAM1 family non-canonical purine NTP pyrophosphatase [Flavobacteriales bacterium]
MKLLFATSNENKVKEIREILKDQFDVLSLIDVGWESEIEENGSTIEENASIKSKAVYDKLSISCFSDDSGLEVSELGGEPGVHSARYADSVNPSSEKNMAKLLSCLEGKKNRKARFKTIVSLIIDSEEQLFEGIVNGHISEYKRGEDGFGYDPIFIPEGYSSSFAEMSSREKNAISHRRIAIDKLCAYLKSTS